VRFVLTTLWILIAGAITAGVYWAFLITPVSTVPALLLSAVLAIVVLTLLGLTANGAIEILSHGASLAGVRRVLRSIPSIVPAALIVVLAWWMTTRAELWVAQASGQINAWFIARFGWEDVSWLFTGVRYVATWFRWVVAGMLALSLMTGFLATGWRAVTQAAWLRRALRPRALLGATLWFVALIALPWTYLVPWRPENLPATSMELAFIIAKLSVSAILFAIAAALMTYEASRVAASPAGPSPEVAAA
jgi:hypothetical protein